MKAFKIKYANGDIKIVVGTDSLEVIRKLDLCTKEHINTRVFELEGEQKAIALADYEEHQKEIGYLHNPFIRAMYARGHAN